MSNNCDPEPPDPACLILAPLRLDEDVLDAAEEYCKDNHIQLDALVNSLLKSKTNETKD